MSSHINQQLMWALTYVTLKELEKSSSSNGSSNTQSSSNGFGMKRPRV